MMLVVAGVVVFGAWLDVRALPRGGSITILDPETDEPMVLDGAAATYSWRDNWRELAQMWLTGRVH